MRDKEPGRNRYDLIPYGSRPTAGAHCRRLEAVATLFGMQVAPPCSARVLDLGCGMGDGLLPQALEYPAARFVGCDLAETHIARAAETAAALGLRNVELWHRDLCDADASWGRFDYIVCNGVFSWVSPDARGRIVEILRNNLAPDGIAYVSFNTLPGWHLRRVARELMCYHSAPFADAHEAIAQARAILALTAESYAADDPFAALIRDEYVDLSRSGDSYLLHEMLSEHNRPFYFREFMEQVEPAGLQYLGAADLAPMFTWDLPDAARRFLEPMPLLVREQYLDFLRGAPFRKCLLCHGEVELDRRLDPSVLKGLFVGLNRNARLQARGSGEGESQKPVAAEGIARLVIGACEFPCPNALASAALQLLDDRRPELVAVTELLDTAGGTLEADDRPDPGALLRFLMDAVTGGALDVAVSPPCVTSRAGERPAVSPLARLQAETGCWLTNQKHESVRLTNIERLVARALDGTRDRRELSEMVSRAIESGLVSLGVLEQVGEPSDSNQLVEHMLGFFGRSALLVA